MKHDELFAQFNRPDGHSFPKVLETLHAHGYTGPVTFHLTGGTPTTVEIPCAVKIALTQTRT